MDFTKLNELKTGNIILRKLSLNDRAFISEVFSDSKVLEHYIVPKEANRDYNNLFSYLMNDIKTGSGFTWIIFEISNSLFSVEKACGFFAFEFRDTIHNARISFALKSEFRGKGIASMSTTLIIDTLQTLGVTSVEADIDIDYKEAEKIVEKLGFTTNKRHAINDMELMQETGIIRFRHLWKKDLALKIINENEYKTGRLPLNASRNEIVVAYNKIVAKMKEAGQHPLLVAKYYYLLGRVRFVEGDYVEAKKMFGNANMVIMQEGLPENHETYYWFATMLEIAGKKEDARMYYESALKHYNGDPDLITKEEIQKAINKLN